MKKKIHLMLLSLLILNNVQMIDSGCLENICCAIALGISSFVVSEILHTHNDNCFTNPYSRCYNSLQRLREEEQKYLEKVRMEQSKYSNPYNLAR